MYSAGPHCNIHGLTSLGAYLINQMIKQHFIVELDHMDNKTADATLSLLEAHHYSGVISAHSWDSPEENPLPRPPQMRRPEFAAPPAILKHRPC